MTRDRGLIRLISSRLMPQRIWDTPPLTEFRMAQLSIVRIDQVYGGQRIVACYPVLDGQNGRGSICIFEKQRIMPHTKTQEDVEIGLLFIK